MWGGYVACEVELGLKLKLDHESDRGHDLKKKSAVFGCTAVKCRESDAVT